jgi:lipoprotein-anchoring transpeptidase ErfK/SrfK
MRKFLMLAVVALMPVLAVPQIAGAATSKPTEQELLLQKKKKAEAARKAEAQKKAAAKKAADAKKQADAKKAAARKSADARTAKVVKRQKVTQASMTPVARSGSSRQQASGSSCRGFLGCLFGGKRNPNVRRASTASAVDDYATAEDVSWSPGEKYAPGSIVVRTPERSLYLVLGDGTARRYKVGVGREGFQWSGNSRIVNKAEWPTWRPPQVMIEREAAKGHFLPTEMAGGPENPLGARALYIGGTMYRIHGTNNASSIGGAVSSGCIRMMNTDVVDLYDRVKVGARVYVYQ